MIHYEFQRAEQKRFQCCRVRDGIRWGYTEVFGDEGLGHKGCSQSFGLLLLADVNGDKGHERINLGIIRQSQLASVVGWRGVVFSGSLRLVGYWLFQLCNMCYVSGTVLGSVIKYAKYKFIFVAEMQNLPVVLSYTGLKK